MLVQASRKAAVCTIPRKPCDFSQKRQPLVLAGPYISFVYIQRVYFLCSVRCFLPGQFVKGQICAFSETVPSFA